MIMVTLLDAISIFQTQRTTLDSLNTSLDAHKRARLVGAIEKAASHIDRIALQFPELIRTRLFNVNQDLKDFIFAFSQPEHLPSVMICKNVFRRVFEGLHSELERLSDSSIGGRESDSKDSRDQKEYIAQEVSVMTSEVAVAADPISTPSPKIVADRTEATASEPEATPIFEQWKTMMMATQKFLKENPYLNRHVENKLVFYANRYLSLTSNISITDAELHKKDANPLQINDFTSYHREYRLHNRPIQKLENLVRDLIHNSGKAFSSTFQLLLLNSKKFKDSLDLFFYYQEWDRLNAAKIIYKIKECYKKSRNHHFISINIPSGIISCEIALFFQSESKKIRDFINRVIKQDEALNDLTIYIGAFVQTHSQSALLLEGSSDKNKIIKDYIIHGGFTPTLQKTFEQITYLSQRSFEREKHSFDLIGLRDKLFYSVSTIHALINHPLFVKHKKIFSEKRSLHFLMSTLCSLIEGFRLLDIEKKFDQKKIRLTLQLSLNRVMKFMKQAQDLYEINKADLDIDKIFDLIFEEILFWLWIAKPYQSKAVERRISAEVSAKSKIIPQMVSLSHSGMKAAMEVMSTVIHQVTGCGKPIHVIVSEDSYYETIKLLQIKGATIDALPFSKEALECLFPITIEDLIQKHRSNKTLVDLLIMDPHQSFQPEINRYVRVDLLGTIEKMLLSGIAQRPLNVIVDTTIGCRMQSDEMDELLVYFKHYIDSGALNVITIASQKFEMFGTDLLSGGYFCVYSNHPESLEHFTKIATQKNNPEERISSFNYQFFAHAYTHTLEALGRYKELIIENTNLLYRLVHPIFKRLTSGELERAMQVSLKAKIDDRQHCICFDLNSNGKIFSDLLEKKGIIYRPGFGFRKMTHIDFNRTMRLSLGIEEPEVIEDFAAWMNKQLTELNRSEFTEEELEIQRKKSLIWE